MVENFIFWEYNVFQYTWTSICFSMYDINYFSLYWPWPLVIKVVRVMKGMSKQFCEYSLGIQKKICQYSFYDKYVFCTVFLTFHNITYNAVKQILIVYKFFMSLNESVKETNIFFFYTPWSFCKILVIFISSLFNFLEYKKGYVTCML